MSNYVYCTYLFKKYYETPFENHRSISKIIIFFLHLEFFKEFIGIDYHRSATLKIKCSLLKRVNYSNY